MTSEAEPRFVLRGPGGEEVALESVEELQERLADGGIAPDVDLFDASTGRWAPAREVPVFLFILEELEAEGRLPEPLHPLLAPDPSEGESARDPDGPGREEDPPAGEEEPPAGPPTSTEDPFSFQMDLVAAPPPADPDASAAAQEPAEAAAEADSPAADPPEETEEPPEDRPAGFTLDPLDDFSFPGLEPSDEEETVDPEEVPKAGTSRNVEEDAWFTPASEGGMVIAGPDDGPAAQWEPEQGTDASAVEPKPRDVFHVRGKVAALLVLVGVAGASWVLVFSSSEAGEALREPVVEQVAVPPIVPPIPEALAGEGQRVIGRVNAAFRSAADSIRGTLGLEGAPPPAWLEGYYLANAGEFPGVVAFWERYDEFIGGMRELDAEVYRRGVAAGIAAEPLSDAERDGLAAYFADRYRRQSEYRLQRYDDLAETARAALRLHQVLSRHQGEIAFSPALGRGVSADPILEAVIPEGPVRREVDRALDEVFAALDRSRRGGPPSADGLRTELFGSFGDSFR